MPVVTPVRASIASQNAVPNCDVFSDVMGPMLQVLEALFGHRKADQAAPVLRHEVDGFGRDLFGGESEIAFVLAVFVVDHHNHASGADFFDRLGDIGEWSVGTHLVAILALHTSRGGLLLIADF